MSEGYDIIDEKSGRVIGFHASNIAGYRLKKHVGCQVTHSSSSSVLADGESGDSVAADPRNDGTTDTSEKESGMMVDFASIAFCTLSFAAFVRAHFAGRVV